MSNPYDVAARLAEGRPVVADVEEYVAACRRLGYQHRDLTAQPTQVRDWYGGDEGMDLHALDADHSALTAAASAAEDAARQQTDLVAAMSAAWSGRGAAAAHEFAWRSCQAAVTAAASLRTAADAVATLRDGLWHAVDAKVAATEAVEAPQRAEWLAAAKTVTTGAGDLAAASELVESKVKPFVDLAVGSEWLAAMRAAISSIDEAYDAAIAGATAAPVMFGVPGELGPRPVPSMDHGAAGGGQVLAGPAPTSPAAAVGAAPVAPASAVPVPVTPGPAPAPLAEAAPLPPVPPAPASAMPSTPAMGDMGAGSSSRGSGLSGFGQQLADLIGGLIGSAHDASTDADDLVAPDDPDDPDDPEDPDDPDDPDDELDAGDDPDPAPDDPAPEGEVAADDAEPAAPAGEPPPDQAAEAPPPPPPPTLAPPPAEPPPVPQPLQEAVPEADEPTPCEIAADALPQVGE